MPTLLTSEEIEIIKLLRPSDGTVRALWEDHDGNKIMMVQWSKEYLEEKQAVVALGQTDKPMDDPDPNDQHIPAEEDSGMGLDEVHYCEQHRTYEINI